MSDQGRVVGGRSLEANTVPFVILNELKNSSLV